MPTLMIGYDLNLPGQDYTDLIARIKTHGAWWHHLDSTWLVDTTMSAKQVRDDLKGLIDSDDELLVIDISGDDWSTFGINDSGNQWLHDHL